MTWFFIEVALLVRSVWHGVRHDTQFRALAILLLSLSATGTIFCHLIEQWCELDARCFCARTISTVGYGNLAPSEVVSTVFTLCHALVGIGLFASFVARLFALRLELYTRANEKHDQKHRRQAPGRALGSGFRAGNRSATISGCPQSLSGPWWHTVPSASSHPARPVLPPRPG